MKVDYEASMRSYCENVGVDLDDLLKCASVHFESPVITRRTEPLSEVELQILFDDDPSGHLNDPPPRPHHPALARLADDPAGVVVLQAQGFLRRNRVILF